MPGKHQSASFLWSCVLGLEGAKVNRFQPQACYRHTNHRAGWGEERFSGWGNIHCVSSGIKLQCI